MAITIEIPADIERELRKQDPHLDDHTRAQFLQAQYEAGKLSTGDIALILGFETRIEAEDWLAARGACRNYSASDLESDRRTLDRILGPKSKITSALN